MQTEIDKAEWTQMFLQDSKEKLDESRNEYNTFIQTGKIIYLQQASNKLFSATENLFMLKYGKLAKSYQHLKTFITKKEDRVLLNLVNRLHIFFYQSTLTETVENMQELYELCIDKVSDLYESIYSRIS